MPEQPFPGVPFGELTDEQMALWMLADMAGYVAAARSWARERAREDIEAETRRRFRADMRSVWAKVRRVAWPFGGRRG